MALAWRSLFSSAHSPSLEQIGGSTTGAGRIARTSPANSTGSGSAIFIGTLLDNVPESIILGMSLALGGAINVAFLVAVFVSNLPEGVAGIAQS